LRPTAPPASSVAAPTPQGPQALSAAEPPVQRAQFRLTAPEPAEKPAAEPAPVPGRGPGPAWGERTGGGTKGGEGHNVFWERLDRGIDVSLQDYRNYYSWPNLGLLALGLGAAAPLANTSADHDIHTWYQRHYGGRIRSVAELFNYSGQIW